MWSVDRLHPSERGHRLLAASFAELLAARSFPLHAQPGLEPTSRPPTRRAEVVWMATRGTKWLYDRANDLVPYLIGMAVREWWYDRRGWAQRADAELEQEMAVAIARLRGNDSLSVRLDVNPALAGAQPQARAFRG
jgi:hypothetical protein